MQSWGTTSRFDERDTQLEPSKSGVIGLICSALGRDREEPVDDLAALRMGVRVDREGVPMRDFQTATGVFVASGKSDTKRTVVSPRYFLADAIFLVGLEGGEFTLLEQIQQSLQSPVWPLSLGRKSFTASAPIFLPDGLSHHSLEQTLREHPLLAELKPKNEEQTLRLLIEHTSDGSIRLDQPIAPFSERRFGPRYVKRDTMPCT
jgi:CRISPR system Cascade subunit CasD